MLSDPNTLNMILENPQIKPLLDSNPQLRQMMSNPEMLRMMLNPQNLQAMSQLGGMGGMGGLGGMPGMGGLLNPNPNNQNTSSSNQNPSSNANLYQGLNFGNMGMGYETTRVDPKVAYKDQNQQLKDMGFINEELNFQVLEKTMGNVDAAVERLLGMMN
jgi:ubiquilin